VTLTVYIRRMLWNFKNIVAEQTMRDREVRVHQDGSGIEHVQWWFSVAEGGCQLCFPGRRTGATGGGEQENA
jgi:hypothetical protein